MACRSGKARGRFRELFDIAKCMPKRPFWLFSDHFQGFFSCFGDVFGLFSALLFLILRRTIFRFQPNDFSFGCD